MRISFFYHEGRKKLVGSLSLEMFRAQPDSPKQADAAISLVLPGEGLLLGPPVVPPNPN